VLFFSLPKALALHTQAVKINFSLSKMEKAIKRCPAGRVKKYAPVSAFSFQIADFIGQLI
jgi:hypothetical protein